MVRISSFVFSGSLSRSESQSSSGVALLSSGLRTSVFIVVNCISVLQRSSTHSLAHRLVLCRPSCEYCILDTLYSVQSS